MTTAYHPDETIAALASPPGSARRGIVRISGPEVVQVLSSLFTPNDSVMDWKNDQNRARSYPGTLQIRELIRPLPVELYLWPNRRSYTGQPLAELHTIGSPPILEAILSQLFASGVRSAKPGEFTLRAFLAGRIDLVQAEGVLGVIDACDARELKTALDQLAGGLSSHIVRLRGDLLDLLADLEAGLDFAEEDIQFVSQRVLAGRLGLARDAVGDLLDRAAARMIANVLPRVVLAGPPNAGKSTLFNVLAGHAAALVSDVRGTTRDYLTSDVALGGCPVTLIDTAGWEMTSEGLMEEAQRLRRDQLHRADLILWCTPADGSTLPVPDVPPEKRIDILTKIDLKQDFSPLKSEASSLKPAPGSAFALSAHTGVGLDQLKSAIASRLGATGTPDGQLLGSTAARCRESLEHSAQALDRALAVARSEADQELLAIEIRDALDALGEIVGAVYTDDLLDRIFSKFCIGK